MAKKKSKAKKIRIFAPIIRGLSSIWRFVSKILGSAVRFIFRSSKELDPTHQRDGIAFFIFILALIFSAGIWFKLDNFLGKSTYAFLFGAVGHRITIGTLLLLISITALIHIINGSVGTGATAIQQGGGWIGYGVSTSLIAVVTEVLAIPILLIVLLFGLLIVTKTSLSKLFTQIKRLFRFSGSGIGKLRQRRAQKLVAEDFEVSESPPFETPLVKDLVQEFEPQQEEFEIELEDFDQITQPLSNLMLMRK